MPIRYYNLYPIYPYSQEAYISLIPYQEKAYYQIPLDGRQIGALQPPPIPPTGQGQESEPPTSPPPTFVPQQTHQLGTYAVDPGSMVRCLRRYTYVWLRGNEQFWFYPTFIGQKSVSGYRWTGSRWLRYGISLREIQSFTCV